MDFSVNVSISSFVFVQSLEIIQLLSSIEMLLDVVRPTGTLLQKNINPVLFFECPSTSWKLSFETSVEKLQLVDIRENESVEQKTQTFRHQSKKT